MQQLIELSNPFVGELARAQAYLDPGSGSFILQLLLAALVGSLFLIKSYWKRLGVFFRRLLRRGEDHPRE